MIYSCPECGKESGVTHGDQLFTVELCETCSQLAMKSQSYISHEY